MVLDQWLVLNVHGVLLCLIITGVIVVFAGVGTLIVHRFIPHHRLKGHNDIAGPIFSTLGVVYAVVLAFVMVVVWQKFDRIKVNTEMEVSCLADLYVDAESFDPSFREQLRGAVRSYTQAIIDEWDIFVEGGVTHKTNNLLKTINTLYSNYCPSNETQKIFFQESVAEMNNLINLRILRSIEGRTGVHALLWLVLIVGGVITVAFTMFFGSENLRAKILMTTFLAIIIALILFTILDFSFPFTGTAAISVESFQHLLAQLQ